MVIELNDLKIIIAYSSIIHMTIVFLVILFGKFVRVKGGFLMMFRHGIISPLIFWVVGILVWFKRRSLLVIKIMFISFIFVIFFFFILILNIGFPPFIGFLAEILIIKVVIFSNLIVIFFGGMVLFSCYYNMYLFWCLKFGEVIVLKFNVRIFDIFLFIVVVGFIMI